MSEKMKGRVPPSLILVPAGAVEPPRSRVRVQRHECDICGVPSPSDGLRLCRDCKALERMVEGDIGLLCTVREVIDSFMDLKRVGEWRSSA